MADNRARIRAEILRVLSARRGKSQWTDVQAECARSLGLNLNLHSDKRSTNSVCYQMAMSRTIGYKNLSSNRNDGMCKWVIWLPARHESSSSPDKPSAANRASTSPQGREKPTADSSQGQDPRSQDSSPASSPKRQEIPRIRLRGTYADE